MLPGLILQQDVLVEKQHRIGFRFNILDCRFQFLNSSWHLQLERDQNLHK
jgi:hypothetical protein